mmetsp:Transcript_19564/g.27305  ORF Transcript_19564/g.27305 Transcript_19564/m.27305 type:complete len:95 (-) Transcript_19564:45-329(-)
MTLFLLGSTFFMMCYVIIALLFVAVPYSINFYVTLRWLVTAAINFLCLFQALAFQRPNQSRMSTMEPKRTTLPKMDPNKEPDMNDIEMESTDGA